MTNKNVSCWMYQGIKVRTHTKSEARALFKLMLGLKRLPIGAVITKEKFDENR